MLYDAIKCNKILVSMTLRVFSLCDSGEIDLDEFLKQVPNFINQLSRLNLTQSIMNLI